jgi:hypothetical protein
MKIEFFVLFFGAFAIAAHAEDSKNVVAEGDWIADAKTGCKVWNPSSLPNPSITWSGGCKDGKANEKGTMTVHAE